MAKRKIRVGDKTLDAIDYKDSIYLRRFLNSQAKIYPPKRYNVDAYSQRQISRAVKRSRHMALLPFTVK
ncbi:MAG: 30S ribosomal protein S18 [Candidatus Moraniibacteriota bacterium]|jgi:small subunit ribosomal protein S18